jgi:hypothetical protein
MLRKNFNDTTSIRVRFGIPLEIAMSMFEDGIQFIALEFVGREKSKIMGIVDECLIKKVTNGEHARCFRPRRDTVFLPVANFEWNEGSVCLFPLSHSEIVVFRDDAGDKILWRTVLVEEFGGFVRIEPLVQKGQLFVIGGRRGEWNLMCVERPFDNFVA